MTGACVGRCLSLLVNVCRTAAVRLLSHDAVMSSQSSTIVWSSTVTSLRMRSKSCLQRRLTSASRCNAGSKACSLLSMRPPVRPTCWHTHWMVPSLRAVAGVAAAGVLKVATLPRWKADVMPRPNAARSRAVGGVLASNPATLV